MTDALAAGRRRAVGSPGGTHGGALLALQRDAGNAAVSALLAAKLKWPGERAGVEIDAAVRQLRRDEPDIDTVEKGLKQAKAVGIPVDLEGLKPPASALAVTRTGFGPGLVAPKKPVPAPKPVPAISPLGKVAAAKPKIAMPPKAGAESAAAKVGAGVGAGAAPAAAPLGAEKLLQPPVPPPGVTPARDPAFAKVKRGVKGFAAAKRAHPPAASKAKEAQDAALAPTDDLAGQAGAAKVDTMDAQQPGTFDKKAFITAVKAAIEAKSPKTLKEADDAAKSGKAVEVKGEVKGLVTQGKEGSARDIEAATAAAPDQSKAVPKPVTPMAEENPGAAVPTPAAGAVPKPAPAEQLNLEAGKHEVDQEMTDAQITDEQLATSGEPEFHGALADKRTAAAHATTAPAEYRQQEQATLTQSRAQAGAVTEAGVQGMQGAKGAALARLVADKGRAKTKDEQKRAAVTTRIQSIFTATETEVKKILDGIDPKVEAEFEQGESKAKASFESYVSAKMSAYKKDRYGGWLGGLRWAKDKLFGMPDKVNEFYAAGRELYLKQMDGVISRVADVGGGDLTAAKQRIAKGRADIATYVKSLPKDLQKVGSQAATEIGERFEQLESEVKDKENQVVDTLATKYVEARKGLDERIEALQAENKGLVDKAIGAIKAVINTIRELAAMLRNALARAASVVGDIIGDPVGFLGNLILGIKGGIDKFFANITAHLKKGLLGWLFGQLGDAGIELPDTFDLKGVIKLLASVFGLTWANIRSRIVRQIGEKAMAAVEKGVEIFQVIATQGIAGLWDKLVEKIGDIKEMIQQQIEDFVITRIITAGITWLISLLNPAAAFIKACKLIYDVVMFFVNNAERIAQFVNTVIDGVVDIAKGNVSAVIDKIENALSQMVPILIGFIASVLGIGGIGEKIRSIIQALQKPVNKALDFIIKTGLKLAAPIIRGIKGISTRVKAKVAAGKAWVKGKAEAGKKWVKGKVAGAGEAFRRLKDRMLGIAFRETFVVKGEKHSVYSKKGAPQVLFTASTPQPSAQAAPTPTVKQLEAQYRATIGEYVATVRLLDGSPRDAALKTRAEGFKDQADRLFRQLVDATRAFVTTVGRKSRGEPVGRAPGIGTIGFHGRKPPSNRGGHRLHWTESEHIMPFAVGKSVWAALRQYMPWRGSRADDRQTTIMIYERAARIKTPADNAMSYTIKNLLVDSRIVENIARGRITGEVGISDRDAVDALARIQGAVETARKDAVARTVDAIRAENQMKEGGAAKTNGERRGNEPPNPDSGQVDAASRTQYDDIMALVREEVMHEAAVKEKAERLGLTSAGRRR
ncbi:phage tail protein [Agromyces bauzanensis]